MILTSEWRAEHSFAGRNTQHIQYLLVFRKVGLNAKVFYLQNFQR